jgi:hypothetical protein
MTLVKSGTNVTWVDLTDYFDQCTILHNVGNNAISITIVKSSNNDTFTSFHGAIDPRSNLVKLDYNN